MVDQPFIEPEQRANSARSEFRKAYTESLAVKLKKTWNTDIMATQGYTAEIDPKTGKMRDPSDEQFTAWAEELINSGGFTFKGKDGKTTGTIDIKLMQSSLDDKAKADLRKDFGTDQLSDIILKREQLNNVSQQVGKATYDHSGSISFLQGATIMDAIRGFFDWMLSGFKAGKDGGFFSGLTDAIKARAANGVGNDLKEMMDNNPSGIHEGVRKFIADKVTHTGMEQVGLEKPNTPPETLKTVKVGQDAPKTQSTGDRIKPPAALTGNIKDDLSARFENVALKSVEPFMGVINSKPENKETLDKVLKVFKEEGTALAMSEEGKKLSKEDFAKKLLETTKKKLAGQGMKVDDPQVSMVLPLVEKQLLADHGNIMAIAGGKAAEVAQKPDAGKPPAPVVLPKDVVKQQVFDQLAPQALEGIENGIIKQIREQRASLDASPKPEPINSRLKERMDSLLKEAESTDPKVKAEGRAKIMSFAAAMGGPNQAQREAMAKEVADATADVLLQKENKGKTKEDLAPQIEKAVRERLTAQRGNIQGMGGKFKLADAQINEAATLVGQKTRELSEKDFASVVMAQNLVDYSVPDKKPPTPMVFDVKRAKDFAKTMPAVISADDMKQAITQETRQAVVGTIDAKRRNGVATDFRAQLLDVDVQGAISSGYAPNDTQRDYIADVVADTVTKVMMDSAVAPSAKAGAVREAVIERLKAEQSTINTDQEDGGKANNPKRFLGVPAVAFYKWKIDATTMNEIADKAYESVDKRQQDFAQMNNLAKPMQVEAPSVPKTPGVTQVATR